MITHTARTPAQAATFDVVLRYFEQYGQIPTTRKLAELRQWKSRNAGAKAVRSLVGVGLLVRRPTPDGKHVLVPVGYRVSNKRK